MCISAIFKKNIVVLLDKLIRPNCITIHLRGGISVVVVHGNNPLVVVAPQADGGPHLKAFRITSSFELVYENFVYAPQFVGGVTLAQGMTPEGIQYVATAPQTRGSPHIRFFNARTGVLMGERFIFDKWQRAPVTLE